MSANDDTIEAATADMCCASCGVAEVDEIQLKKCDDCDLVRYCSDTCQQDHRPEHEAKCKERVAELRDELLFRQPESSYLGDCPICFLPFSIDVRKSTLYPCCMKMVCIGCDYADSFTDFNEFDRDEVLRELKKMQNPMCPFCRQPMYTTEKQYKKNVMKRMKKNDPAAFREMGSLRYKEGDYNGALECYRKAIELGDDVESHCRLAGCMMYRGGEENGVERDEEKEIYHLEEAAIAGHPEARCILAMHEIRKVRLGSEREVRIGRALKHYEIAANLGHDESLQRMKNFYKYGGVSKDVFADTLRAHQAAVDATKSPQREAADKYYVRKIENRS